MYIYYKCKVKITLFIVVKLKFHKNSKIYFLFLKLKIHLNSCKALSFLSRNLFFSFIQYINLIKGSHISYTLTVKILFTFTFQQKFIIYDGGGLL